MGKGTKATPSLLDSFRRLDETTKVTLADIRSPLILGLAALTLAQDRVGREYLSLEHIQASLEVAGISVKGSELKAAMARAGKRVSRQVFDGETHYKVMILGRRVAEDALRTGNLNMAYVEANKPRTARKKLGELLGQLSGMIRICDPYYGAHSLDSLELIPSSCSVRFLTSKTNENQFQLKHAISDFKRENPNIQMRIHMNISDLHDRYVLSKDKILLVGHGLKDIGGKESFVVSVDKTFAADLISQLRTNFDSKWSTAQAL